MQARLHSPTTSGGQSVVHVEGSKTQSSVGENVGIITVLLLSLLFNSQTRYLCSTCSSPPFISIDCGRATTFVLLRGRHAILLVKVPQAIFRTKADADQR